jgi:predicted lipoprotein with Yx(FWY)xxD motif
MLHRLTVAVFAALLSGAPAWAFDAPRGVKVVNTEHGRALADEDGMTLYVYDRDPAFDSLCRDACAKNWPPLVARKGADRVGRFLAIERADGTSQWTYAGKPLYRWSKDREEGDVTGHGLAGVWRIAQP